MTKLAKLILSVGLAVGVSNPGLAQDTVTSETVIANVNGTDITLGHMILAREVLPEQYRDLPADVLFDGLRDQLIQQTVLVQSLAARTKRLDYIVENETRALIAGEALNIAAAAAVTESSLQAAYDAQYADAEGSPEFNASHILVEEEAKAIELIEKIAAGAEFADLAREHSTGPSGPNGGQLGWFGPGMMVKPFEDAVMMLDVGAVSVPVQTQFGWHVIRLNETRAQPVPELDAVRDELVSQLERQAAEASVTSLMDAAAIDLTTDIDPAVILDTSLLED